jgi:cytochrome c556
LTVPSIAIGPKEDEMANAHWVFPALGLLIAAIGMATAQTPVVQAPAPRLTAEQIVAARQASMDMSGAVRGYMKIAVNGGTEPKKTIYPSDGLAKWAKALPSMFPAGTGPDAIPTHAKPEIWSDRAGFERAANDFIAQTERLSQFAHANDTVNFTAQLEVVGKSCTACHDAYQNK